MVQNPKIALTPKTKGRLDSLKKSDDESYESTIKSLISYNVLQPQPQPLSAVVGAGSGDEAFNTYTHTLRWIADTKKKLTAGGDYDVTPAMREEAYNIDPLISGIITPFLKNTILGTGSVQTADNKKYSACIEDITQFLKEIQILKIFRDDFEDYAVKHGHSYRRKDYFPENNTLKKLQRLETSAMTTYEDPWDSDIVAYHQRIYVTDIWSSTQASKMSETNSWFIPGGKKLIATDGIEADGAGAIWDQFRTRYNIDETTGLRVGDSADIIAMHKVRPGKPAPIDSAILAVWLKRLILANGPNYIFSVIMPFLHLKQGVMLKVPDGNGGEKLITSVPPAAPAGMATTDPERYAAMNADRSAYTKALEDNVKNIMRYRAEGGLFASSPDIELAVTESGRNISAGFIQTMISMLDEDIARAFGFPLTLITATGAALATTRNVLELFNTAYVGSRQDYEQIANDLIEEQFEGQTWDYEIQLKDGTVETGSYTIEEAGAEWKLETGDVKDALKEAQVRLADMQALQVAKTIGASKPDIQALADEQGFGLLDLDKFDTAGQPPALPWQPGSQMQSITLTADKREKLAELEHEQWVAWSKNIADTENITPERRARWEKLWRPYSELTEVEKDQDREWVDKMREILSIAQDIKPEAIPNEDEKLKDELMAAYQAAKKDIGKLFEV